MASKQRLLQVLITLFLAVQGTLLPVSGQVHELTGRVFERETGRPVPDVTVYLNATSKGTITGPDGKFRLHDIRLPAELIISHISYEVVSIPLFDPGALKNLEIKLDPRVISLEEATVIHWNVRDEYLGRFKRWFLGAEYGEYDAEILNDSVLMFHILDNDQFTVSTGGPLLIDLPFTGYRVWANLVHFSVLYSEELEGYHCSFLGYYLFEPVEPGSRRAERQLARNRAETYYNTSMHFCRSLFHNQLAENGYVLENDCEPADGGQSGRYPGPYFRVSHGNDDFGNRRSLLTGFDCMEYAVVFAYNARNRPVDLSYLDSHPSKIERSGIRFLSDTIYLYPSGRIPGNLILFSGSIGRKGVAFMLPEDYIPAMR